MATDVWQRTRDGVTAIWRRVHPDRADAVAGELDLTRDEILAARNAGDTQTEAELQAEWQGRVRRLLQTDPAIAADLRTLLDELSPESATSGDVYNVQLHARATGNGRVYQAGRDQHIKVPCKYFGIRKISTGKAWRQGQLEWRWLPTGTLIARDLYSMRLCGYWHRSMNPIRNG